MTKLNYIKLQWIDPQLVLNCVSDLEGVIFLDSSSRHSVYGRYSFIIFEPLVTYLPQSNQFQVSTNHNVIYHDNIQEALTSWQELFAKNKSDYNNELPPFIGGLVGYFSYDLSKDLEGIPQFFEDIVPKYCFGLYNKVIAFDHVRQKTYLIVHEIDGFAIDANNELNDLEDLYSFAWENHLPDSTTEKFLSSKIKADMTKEEYFAMLHKARECILDGEFYEINLAQRFYGKLKPNYSGVDLYNKLRTLNKAPFAAYLDFNYLFMNDFKIFSASPERFLKVTENSIEARPIKGTIKRSTDYIEDKRLADELANSEKDRAENIMIVDLLRNDLGKICKPRSINVSQLCGVESFTNLHHMVSVINGELLDDKSSFDIIPAAFPGGSITGAPKIRAMQMIEELEKSPRGVYCGSIGYFSFNGNTDLNIAIRTISIINDDLIFHAGGAITLDSDFEEEYKETLLKAQKIFEIF